MNCPKCGNKMEIEREKTTSDSRNGKEYDKMLYVCKSCDVWVSVETPKSKVLK